MTIGLFVGFAFFIVCLVYVLSVVIENSDGHYEPSEESKQAQADQARLLREINKPTYQQPNRSNS